MKRNILIISKKYRQLCIYFIYKFTFYKFSDLHIFAIYETSNTVDSTYLFSFGLLTEKNNYVFLATPNLLSTGNKCSRSL